MNPVKTIGILGGGQLGRMLALAAAKLGLKSHIFCPDPQSPAFDVTSLHTCAAYDDQTALRAFANAVDVITYEFENIPDATVEFLAAQKPLFPDALALKTSQDRLLEKEFLSKITKIAPFAPVTTRDDLDQAVAHVGLPAVLKTTRFGYDGKGQYVLRTPEDLDLAFAELSGQALVLEQFVPFTKEISIIAARKGEGDDFIYDPAENVHINQILATSSVPANISNSLRLKAAEIARDILGALNYVGVIGIEFFVVEDEEGEHLLVNEIAPRVHNSGHWTESVCITDQFEQHIRAVAGLPLGDPSRIADVIMHNLIGDEFTQMPDHLANPHTSVHAYGKAETRAGRKMGHINVVSRWLRPN